MALAQTLGLPKSKQDAVDEDLAEDLKMATRLDGPVTVPVPLRDVAGFVSSHLQGKKMQMLKGTTTLGFVYEPETEADKGGIIIAVDSRASSGRYVFSSTVMKIVPITDCIASTLAGGAGDCQFWLRLLSKTCKLYEVRTKNKMTASACSKMLQNILCDYKGMGLSMGCIIGGPDVDGMGLYMVNDDGLRKKGKIFSTGSGSLNAYGILDTFYRPKMSDKDARDLGKVAIMHATYRDVGSGGRVTVCHLTGKTCLFYDSEDVSELMHKFLTKS